MCNKDCISTTMIKIDKGLVSSIVSCQIDIKIVNSTQYHSIFKNNQKLNTEGRNQKKGKEKTRTDPILG